MDSVLAGDACHKPGRSWESRKAMHGESKREQQFYRFYGPFRQMSDYGPRFCDVRDPDAREKHKPVSCPDTILTAFCQLGALRMKARRCLIFFFDVNHAYVMAEATRTLSLQNDAIYGPGDELWMGHSAIPRNVACCETTVNLPSFPTSATPEDVMSKSAFVVNDLTKHPDLSTRPYVTGFPNGRFYAGVPITTPDGVNIGAYCILDDKVRGDLSKEDLAFLGDMSQTVMAHLETVRALSERQQSNRMVAGLGDFVRGASDTGRKASPATNMPLNEEGLGNRLSRTVEYRIPESLFDPIRTPAIQTPHSTRSDYFDIRDYSHQPSGSPQVPDIDTISVQRGQEFNQNASANDWKNSFLDRQMRTDSWEAIESSAPVVKDYAPFPPPYQVDEADRLKGTYQRAAETLCRSLDVDGVAFLDASVRVFGGLSEAQNAESNEGSTADSDDSIGVHSDSVGDEPQTKSSGICQVLGCAQTLPKDRVYDPEDRPAKKLTESFLGRLMRRNPHGKIWTFDENFITHSEDGFSTDDSGGGKTTKKMPRPGISQRKTARRERRTDGEILQAAFPGSRCIALHGIWDHMRRRWSVGGLYWTYDPFKLIAKETEMHFVAAFCDIVVAETRRFEVLGSDKAKSDFISSVSHELRSPLHGILGSCEILSEHRLDDTASALLEQINSCGHTLLQIIDHLLDFANIKSQRLRKGTVKSSRIGRNFLPRTGGSSVEDVKALNTSVELDDLTEDAVVSSIYSFHYNQDDDERPHTPVILDIDRSAGKDWHCSLATGGWKRVCINLVTNALKYTPYGFVRISLKQKPKPGPRRKFDAVLTVVDSGKGMSREFQNDHLFHDFSQEDTLSDGLGLGMHMVSRMVHAMGGKIDVKSDQNGTGTRVTVRVPLEYNQETHNRTESKEKSRVTAPKAFEGLKIGLVVGSRRVPRNREESLAATASAMAAASIENTFKFLGAGVEQCIWQSDASYDIKVILEAELAACLVDLRSSIVQNREGEGNGHDLTPILVICNNSPSAQILRDMWTTDDLKSHIVMEHIALPCGIKQIIRATNSALRLQKQRIPGISTTLDTDEEPEPKEPVPELDPLDLPGSPSSTTSLPKEEFETRRKLAPLQVAPILPQQGSPVMTLPSHLSNRPASVPQDTFDEERSGVDAQESPPAEAPTASTISPATKVPFLLLVDDNSINLKLLTTFATKRKYAYISAVDGQLAVDAFENAYKNSRPQNNPDTIGTGIAGADTPNIILMDINMPVMDGYEAVQRIRAFEKKYHMTGSKIIAVTALQSEAAHVEAFGSGFDMFLTKPLKMKDLAALIEA